MITLEQMDAEIEQLRQDLRVREAARSAWLSATNLQPAAPKGRFAGKRPRFAFDVLINESPDRALTEDELVEGYNRGGGNDGKDPSRDDANPRGSIRKMIRQGTYLLGEDGRIRRGQR